MPTLQMILSNEPMQCASNCESCQGRAMSDPLAGPGSGQVLRSVGARKPDLTLDEVLHENAELCSFLSSLDHPVLQLCSALRLRSFNEAAASVLDVSAADLGTRPPALTPFVQAAELEQVCLKGQAHEATIACADGRYWVCRMLPHASPDAGGRGLILVLLRSAGPLPVHLPASATDALTARQRQILDLLLAGYPNKNIAADLNISQRTVESHRAEIMRRMGARSLPALTRIVCGIARSGDICQRAVQMTVFKPRAHR